MMKIIEQYDAFSNEIMLYVVKTNNKNVEF